MTEDQATSLIRENIKAGSSELGKTLDGCLAIANQGMIDAAITADRIHELINEWRRSPGTFMPIGVHLGLLDLSEIGLLTLLIWQGERIKRAAEQPAPSSG